MKILNKKIKNNIAFLLIFSFALLSIETNAQYTSKKIKSKHQVYTDSLKQVEYNYTFPILVKVLILKGLISPTRLVSWGIICG